MDFIIIIIDSLCFRNFIMDISEFDFAIGMLDKRKKRFFEILFKFATGAKTGRIKQSSRGKTYVVGIAKIITKIKPC